MLDSIFDNMAVMHGFFWGYAAFILIILLGCYLTLHSRFFQIREFFSICKTFFQFMKPSSNVERGVHPLKVFFASVGSMIGIGNVVGIVTAIQLGGQGALFWVWIAALVGTIIKYAEIYLGLKHRVKNDQGSYDGGPMYFLKAAFKNRWIPILVASLLCIYGVDVYQFSVVTESLSSNLNIDRYLVIGLFLSLVLYSSAGGISRIGKICSTVMPIFITLYVSMCAWVIFQSIHELPEIIKNVFVAAFTGQAAVGGFVGSSALLAIQHGLAQAAYSADIGIGSDSIIQSESTTAHPEKQARLAILGVCLDNLVCTMSILVVLVSGIWISEIPIASSHMVQTALSKHFPYMELFIPFFLFIAGYTTIIAYFCIGIKCAVFLSPKYGKQLYMFYGTSALITFSFLDQSQALLVMSLTGALLLIINLFGIFILRHQIVFASKET